MSVRSNRKEPDAGSAMLAHKLLTLAAAALVLTACTSKKPKPTPEFEVGERIELPPFIYNIVETKWYTHLGEGAAAKVPEHRFLVIRFTSMNTSAHDAHLPQFTLVDNSGNEFGEVSDAAQVEGWLGLSRTVVPAGTLEGSVVFDVSPSTYKLRIEDPLDETKAVLVALPLSFETPEPFLPQVKPDEGLTPK